MVAEAMNCAFQLPPDGVPRELHKQSPSDTMDDRQMPSAIWTRHSTLLTLIQRSRKGLLSNHLGCPTSGISLCRGGGRDLCWHLSKTGSIGNVIQECSLVQWILNFMNLVSIFMLVSLLLMPCSWENLPP